MARDTLTRPQIVKAAVELLDADGLEGLNMRALGTRLGSAATAVYWHVGSKENLIALAGDLAWSEVELPDLAETAWRPAATRMAADVHAMLIRHPWLVQAFGSVLMAGEGKARHDDHSLAIFEAAGFSGREADQASATLLTFILGNAVASAAVVSLRRKLARDGGDAEALLRETKAASSAIAARYPRLRARLEADADVVDYSSSPVNSFEFGLEAILDGLEARLVGERR